MTEWLRDLLRGPALWAGMVCLAWAGGIAAWCVVRLRRRLAAGRRFVQRALQAGFDRAEAQVLWTLGRHAESGRREAILESVEAFDLCVSGAEHAAGDDPLLWPDFLSGSATAALRRKLSRPRAERARHHISDTREMEENQLVGVRLGDGPVFKSFTLNVSEHGLVLSLPEDLKRPARMAGAAGQTVLLSFWRAHDARYECASRATVEEQPEGWRLAVGHASLNRVQQREHVRVRCRQEVRLGVARAPTESDEALLAAGRANVSELPFVAVLRDISNGGASFVGAQQIAPGSRVLLRLKLARRPGALTLRARMLRQSLLEGTSNPLWASAVQFEPLSGRTEHHLSRFIADLQQRMISRLLSRVGGDEQAAAEAGAGRALAAHSAPLRADPGRVEGSEVAGRAGRESARTRIPVGATGIGAAKDDGR